MINIIIKSVFQGVRKFVLTVTLSGHCLGFAFMIITVSVAATAYQATTVDELVMMSFLYAWKVN